jgi:hypothetical protein
MSFRFQRQEPGRVCSPAEAVDQVREDVELALHRHRRPLRPRPQSGSRTLKKK